MMTNLISIQAKQLVLSTLCLFSIIATQIANAGLLERIIIDDGFGEVQAYYDDVLDITWLKDANFAKTSGYDNDGKMTWTNANAWAAQLSLGSYDDWRLPSLQIFNYDFRFDGTSSRGYNISNTVDEMSYMFHVNLGLDGVCDGDNNEAKSCDKTGIGFHNTTNNTAINTSTLGNSVAISNLMSDSYWSDSELAQNPNFAWLLYTNLGYTYTQDKTVTSYGWAVRSGDISQVPEPSTIVIFFVALISLIVKQKKTIKL